MKTVRNIIFAGGVLSLTFALISPAHAMKGAEGGGGGQIVDTNSSKELMDLVTHAVCEWRSGDQMITSHPDFVRRIIVPLRKLDWYFADSILKEAHRLRYCLTGALRRVRPVDWGSPVHTPSQRDVEQGGYRLGDVVYLDQDLFNDAKVSEKTRSFLLLHEVMHSYLPMWVFERQLKLRSMVHTISRVVSGEVRTRDQLHFQMRQNDIQFPLTVDRLDPYRLQLEFLLADVKQQQQMITRLPDVNSILDVPATVVGPFLTDSDRDQLLASSPRTRLENALIHRLQSEDIDGFKKLISSPRYQRLHPMILVLSSLDYFSTDKIALILSQDLQDEMKAAIYRPILNAQLAKLQDGRAALNEEANAALGGTASGMGLLDLRSPASLPQGFGALANLLINLAQTKQWNSIAQVAGLETPFFPVIHLVSIRQAVARFHFTYAIETKMARKRVTLIAERINELFLQQLRENLTLEQMTKVKNLIFKGK